MAFADCTGCHRRHKRPVNTRCEYLKSARDHCVSLQISTSEYVRYLPELLDEDLDPDFDYINQMAGTETKSPRPGNTFTDSENSMHTSLLRELVSENVKSRKLFESNQQQVERMMSQLLDLKISSQRMQSVPSVPLVTTTAVVTAPVTTVTMTPATMTPSSVPMYSSQSRQGPLMTNFSVPSTSVGAPWTAIPPGFLPSPTACTWANPSVIPGALATTTTTAAATASTAAVASTAAAQSSGPFTWPAGVGLPAASAVPTTTIPSSAPPAGMWAPAKTPYLPPYLIPGASQRETIQVPYGCETDYHHPPRHSCSTSTGKRKLTVFDLDIHMRYASSANATKDDVIAGSLSLLESMLRQGVDGTGYMKHIRFLVEKSKVYSQAALIGYDTEMRERAEYFGPSVFMYGDHDLTHRWLGVESLKQSVTASSGAGRSKKKGMKISKYGSCWGWNENKACKAIPCKYKHVCSSCSGDHKQVDCTSKASATTKGSK